MNANPFPGTTLGSIGKSMRRGGPRHPGGPLKSHAPGFSTFPRRAARTARVPAGRDIVAAAAALRKGAGVESASPEVTETFKVKR
jgi:hypothetical protein